MVSACCCAEVQQHIWESNNYSEFKFVKASKTPVGRDVSWLLFKDLCTIYLNHKVMDGQYMLLCGGARAHLGEQQANATLQRV